MDSPRKQAVVLSHGSPARAVVFAPDGRTAVTGCGDGSIHFWELPRKKEVRVLRGHKGRVNALAFPREGKLLASAGEDGFVRLWTLRDGEEKRAIATGVGKVTAMAISPDGRFVVAGGNSHNVIRVWQVASGRQRFEWEQYGDVHSLSYSPRGDILAAGVYVDTGKMRFGRIRLWEATNDKKLSRRQPSLDGHYIAFSPGGRILASVETYWDNHGFLPRSVWLWEMATGKRLTIFGIEDKAEYTALVYAPDGTALITGREDKRIGLWEPFSCREILRLVNLEGPVKSLAISPDGKTLAAALETKDVLLWDLGQLSGKLPQEKASDEQLHGWWKDLAGENALAAYHAGWCLAAVPTQTTAFLRDRLQAVPSATAERIRQLIRELEGTDLSRRDRASKELTRLGTQAEFALQRELTEAAAEDMRLRIQSVLKEISESWPVKDPETLRSLRAIGVLQRIGTPQAKGILQKLAKGASQNPVTQLAEESLDYLAKQVPK